MSNSMQFNRRQFLRKVIAGSCTAGGMFLGGRSPADGPATDAGKRAGRKTPVILATDIGDDIDDTWALGFLLKCPELDLKLVVGEYGKAQYRAKLLAKFLQTVRYGSVPIGIGMDSEPRGEGGQAAWIKNYSLKAYPGRVHPDGVQAIIDTVMTSTEKVTIISIGPMPNVAAALEREPKIAQRARLVGMYGSVRRGYDNSKTIAAEWNVKADPKACQRGLAAPWDVTITPLDTCGVISLDGRRYQRLLNCQDVIGSTIIENYRVWSKSGDAKNEAAEHHSTVLFDTVAVYLALSQDLCKMEQLGIRVSDDGYTRIDNQAKMTSVATEWKNLDGFRDLLVTRLTGEKQ